VERKTHPHTGREKRSFSCWKKLEEDWEFFHPGWGKDWSLIYTIISSSPESQLQSNKPCFTRANLKWEKPALLLTASNTVSHYTRWKGKFFLSLGTLSLCVYVWTSLFSELYLWESYGTTLPLTSPKQIESDLSKKARNCAVQIHAHTIPYSISIYTHTYRLIFLPISMSLYMIIMVWSKPFVRSTFGVNLGLSTPTLFSPQMFPQHFLHAKHSLCIHCFPVCRSK